MDVSFKVGKIRVAPVAKTGILDAIIWFWFHQISYQSAFTASIDGIPALGTLGMVVSVIICIAILATKWDATPLAFNITIPILAALSVGGLLAVESLSLGGSAIEIVLLMFFVAACFGCQVLRLENLAKCSDIRNLSLALICSFILYYVLSFIFILVPHLVYDVFIILAPLSLLVGTRAPLMLKNSGAGFSKKTFFNLPNLLVILFGVAGGFIFAAGNISSATELSEIFSAPAPSYLIMLMLYMELGILVAFGFGLKKTMYFVLMNLAWSIGRLVGALVLQITPIIPDSLSVIISAIIVVCYFLFQNTWVEEPRYVIEPKEVAAEDLARSKGLSKREIEVVLLLLEGRSLRYIQEQLYISEGTARTHTKRIYAKLDVHSKQELIDYFKEN